VLVLLFVRTRSRRRRRRCCRCRGGWEARNKKGPARLFGHFQVIDFGSP
jgi:hypothetical protein